jgi:hypothetical protein
VEWDHREARICYERAEPLCQTLNRPLPLYSALIGQWRHSLLTDKLSATLRSAQRFYSLAQGQNNAGIMIGSYRALANTLYYLGDFENAREYAMRGIQLWRAGGIPPLVEGVHAPAVLCLCYEALCAWHYGEIASCRESMAKAISLAKALKDMHALAAALFHAGCLGHYERNSAEVERLASDLIELSTRQGFSLWLRAGEVLRSWARSTAGSTAHGVAFAENLIRYYRTTGSTLLLPSYKSSVLSPLRMQRCLTFSIEKEFARGPYYKPCSTFAYPEEPAKFQQFRIKTMMRR